MAATFAAALLGCGGPGGPAESDGDILFSLGSREELAVVDVESGEVAEVPVRRSPPDTALRPLVRSGAKIVFFGAEGPVALGRDPASEQRKLGEAWTFTPSAKEGRVWLGILDPQSPDTVRALKAVSEVTVDGRVTVPEAPLPEGRWSTLLAAVKAGLIFSEHDEQGRDRLVVWDPVARAEVRRIPGAAFLADTHGNLVAWSGGDCPRWHITDVATGRDTVIRPGTSFAFECTYEGAFSPDGSLLALPVLSGDRDGAGGGQRRNVALIEVRTGSARLIDGARLEGAESSLAWSSSGERLYFADREGKGIHAYYLGARRLIRLPVEIQDAIVDMAAL